jgi:hypothetical protein
MHLLLELTKHKDAIQAFSQKWANEIAEFENALFVEDENEDIWLLVKPKQELNISTSDYSVLDDKPNKSRAILKFLVMLLRQTVIAILDLENWVLHTNFTKIL